MLAADGLLNRRSDSDENSPLGSKTVRSSNSRLDDWNSQLSNFSKVTLLGMYPTKKFAFLKMINF